MFNFENKNNKNQIRNQAVLVCLVFVVFASVSGCSSVRRTENGSVAEVNFGFKLFPTDSADTEIAFGNKAVETTTQAADTTNAHTSRIERSRFESRVTRTNTQGPGTHASYWSPENRPIREDIRN